jgi:hypothetical protein
MGLKELQELRENRGKPKEKKQYRINKVAAKTAERKAKEAADVEDGKAMTSGGADLKRWFADRRKELTGSCAHCGGRSCKDSEQYWKFSIAHVLPKNLFKSVATHPKNFIELCFFNNSCHTNFDNKTLDIMDLNCFDTVISRFIEMYPSIAAKERRFIPDILLQYAEAEK